MDFDEEELDRLSLRPGDLLVCEGGEIGRTAMWQGELDLCFYQNHLHRLRSCHDGVEPTFYMYWIQAAWTLLGLYRGQGNSTTIPNLSRSRLASLPVPMPPLEEQQAIARVLQAIQHAKDATEQVIAAMRDLKKGLMQHLFTYGPVPVEEAARVPLRETEIGLIPEQWSVVRLGDIAQKPQYGLTASSVSSPIGPKLLRITDIQDGKVKWDEVPYCKISEDVCSKYRLEPGDLLVARIGATTGKTFLVSECPESVFGSYLIRVRVYQDRLLPPFLYYFTQTQYYWSQINAVKDGRLKKGINIPILSSLQVPLPSLREQEEIVRLLSALDWKIQAEEIRVQALDGLFKTVLHLLMTGRVRVKDLPRSEIEGVSPGASRE